MRFWIGVLAGAAAAVGVSSSAWAESPFYVSGSIGGYFRESDSGPVQLFHSDVPDINVSGTTKRGFDPGEIGNLAAGYRLNAHVRIEAELGYATYAGSTLNPSTSAPGFPNLNGQTFRRTSGDRFARTTESANVFYDFAPLAGRFSPYVGGGLGVAESRKAFGDFAAANGVPFAAAGNASTQGVGMVEGGVSIAITRNLSLVPAYRYMRFFGSDFAIGQDVAHVVKVGLRYQF